MKFEVDGLLRADAATRSEVYSRALDPITGWLDVDEVRALEDLPPRAAQNRRLPAAPLNGNGALSRSSRAAATTTRRSDPGARIAAASGREREQPARPPTRTVRRVVRDEDGRIEAVVDEPEQNTTNGHVEAISK